MPLTVNPERRYALRWVFAALFVGAGMGVVLIAVVFRLDPSEALGTWVLVGANAALAVAAFVAIRQTGGLERRHEAARRRAVEARVGISALALQMDLARWVEDAPDTVMRIVHVYDELKASPAGDVSAVMVVPENMKNSASFWALERVAGDIDPRIQRLVEDSPDVSDDLSRLITEVCARWVKMNWLFTKVRRDSRENVIDPKDIAIAWIELNACVELLDRVIPLQLRAAATAASSAT